MSKSLAQRGTAVPLIVFIEGNIGAGKSTVLREIRARGFPVVAEPVDAWKFFARRHSDPQRWTFTFQIEALLSMASLVASAPGGSVVFVERSVQSALLFSEAAFETGLMSQDELDLLRTAAEMVGTSPVPSMTVCIDVAPSTCYARLRQRQRPEERVTEEYIALLDRKHKKMPGWTYVDGSKPPFEVAAGIVARVTEAWTGKHADDALPARSTQHRI